MTWKIDRAPGQHPVHRTDDDHVAVSVRLSLVEAEHARTRPCAGPSTVTLRLRPCRIYRNSVEASPTETSS